MGKEKIVTHASHSKLQYYRHNYCQVCMTGLLGGRWHRYQQSQRDSRKRDFGSYACIVAVELYVLYFFYSWLVLGNNIYFITRYMELQVHEYIPWYELGLSFSATTAAYFFVILILCFLHVKYGHQVFIHPIHLVITAITFVCCIVVTLLFHIFWSHLPAFVLVSLKVFGPFIQLAAVIFMTAISWSMARNWNRLTNIVYKALWLLLFILTMSGLYLCPLGINSPLVRSRTPPRPDILAKGGASSHGPEQTIFAFKKAVEFGVKNLGATVQISADGVPFIFDQSTLASLIDGNDDVFQNMTMRRPARYNIDFLQSVHAGKWFLKNDPWDTVSELTDSERVEISLEKIPTLEEFLTYAMEQQDVNVYLSIKSVATGHPCLCSARAKVNEVIEKVPKMNISRLRASVTERINNSFPGVLDHTFILDEDYIASHNVKAGMLKVGNQIFPNIRVLNNLNVTTIAKGVNSLWLFSLMWCAEVSMVETRFIKFIQKIDQPIWKMNEESYTALWVTIDLLSLFIIVVMFIYHRIKLYGTNFSPESISLNTGRTRTSYRSRTMKEKLLREGAIIDSIDEMEARDNDGLDNRPAYSMTSGQQAYSLSSLAGTDLIRDTNTSASMSAMESHLAPPVTVPNRYSV